MTAMFPVVTEKFLKIDLGGRFDMVSTARPLMSSAIVTLSISIPLTVMVRKPPPEVRCSSDSTTSNIHGQK